MTQLLHLVRKDLRRLRWPLATWIVILVTRVFVATAGPALAIEGMGEQFVFQQLESVFDILEKLMLAVLVARLIHEEPLVGLNAFWLTRPYDRGALLGAKLLFAGAALIVAPLMADLTMMVLFDTSVRDLLHATPAFLSGHIRWALGFMVVAVLTSSMAAFALAIIGTVVAFALTAVVVLSIAVLNVDESSNYATSLVVDLTPALVALVIFVFASLGVIVYQYRNRRRPRALLFVAAGIAALVVVPSQWPWPFVRPVEPDPGAWSRDSTRAAAAIDLSQPLDVSDVRSLRRSNSPRRQLSARVRLVGMPGEFERESVGARSRLELPGGVTLQSAQMEGVGRQLTGAEDDAGSASPIQGLLGEVRLARVANRGEWWPTLLTMTDEEYARHRGQSGRLAATLDFHLRRFRVVGALPLVEGSRLDEDFTRIEIVGVRRRPDGCLLLLRHWRVQSLLTQPRDGNYQFVLRNRVQREALTTYAESLQVTRPSFGAGFLGFSLAVEGSGGFVVQNWALQFPSRDQPLEPRVRIDPGWLDAADLVVIDRAYAGRVTRSLTVDDFQIP
jgi:ABC-type transport system involved in multi-copper enzyme maturation permease subunit